MSQVLSDEDIASLMLPMYGNRVAAAMMESDDIKTARIVEAAILAKLADKLKDAERLDWLLMEISGKEFRRIGVSYSAGCIRSDIDAAIDAQKGQS